MKSLYAFNSCNYLKQHPSLLKLSEEVRFKLTGATQTSVFKAELWWGTVGLVRGLEVGAESMVDCWWSHVELEKDNNSWRGLLRVNKYLFVSLHGNYAQSASLQSPEWRELVPQKDLLIESCSAWSELQLCNHTRWAHKQLNGLYSSWFMASKFPCWVWERWSLLCNDF